MWGRIVYWAATGKRLFRAIDWPSKSFSGCCRPGQDSADGGCCMLPWLSKFRWACAPSEGYQDLFWPGFFFLCWAPPIFLCGFHCFSFPAICLCEPIACSLVRCHPSKSIEPSVIAYLGVQHSKEVCRRWRRGLASVTKNPPRMWLGYHLIAPRSCDFGLYFFY